MFCETRAFQLRILERELWIEKEDRQIRPLPSRTLVSGSTHQPTVGKTLAVSTELLPEANKLLFLKSPNVL